MNVLELKDLTIRVKGKPLYEKLSFNVQAGSITGLLGNNGVGKTLLLKRLVNLEKVEEGQVIINGKENNLEEFRKDVVYIPDSIGLINHKTIKENIAVLTFNREYDVEFVNRYLKKFKLDQDTKVGDLSKGNKEMVQLITLISIDASLYVFDEPFSAMDVFRREYVLEIMLDRIHEQCAFVITTHLINELEPILDHLLYINDNKLVLDVDTENIQEEEDFTSLVEYIKKNYPEVVDNE